MPGSPGVPSPERREQPRSTVAIASSEPDKRPLSDEEVRLLRTVFGEGLVHGRVRLVKLSAFINQLNGSRAFVLGNTMNLPAWAYDGLPRGQHTWLLVHEATHVWQYQHHGWGYIPQALWAQSFGGGYDYVKPLREGKPWRKMNPEQQAQLLEDAFRGEYFDAPGALFGVVRNRGTVVRPGGSPPEGFTDYTSVLEKALEELRTPR